MGALIRAFAFDRNTLKKNTKISADAVLEHIEMVTSGAPLNKTASNIIGALAHYMGVFEKVGDSYRAADVANAFSRLSASNKEDAYQWLLTRALWRFSIPNGTACKANEVAEASGVEFSLFSNLLRLLIHMKALPGKERFLYHEEFCRLFDEDSNWTKTPEQLFNDLQSVRQANGLPREPRRLLGDLEPEYSVPRDNLNGFLNKAMLQTGLFEAAVSSGGPVAIALSSTLGDVLQRRVRYIVDHPASPAETGESWTQFLSLHPDDLPQEAAAERRGLSTPTLTPEPLDKLLHAAQEDFAEAGLRLGSNILRRFVSSLLTKPFVILTGLSGSGKTKLAQAFAAWLTHAVAVQSDRFTIGQEVKSDRISYYIEASDGMAVTFLNKEDHDEATRVCLPRELIAEWVEAIEQHSFTRETAARKIREAVAETTKYSPQLNSFETHLKAAAFAQIEHHDADPLSLEAFRVVPVGADWDNNENLVGYPDALRVEQKGYNKPANGALDLIIQASLPENMDRPFFIVLDEMNLSHVERYFADVLSTMESGEPIELHQGLGLWGEERDVPSRIRLPDNLFIVGTVNIDETTYLFSPKVLDRANVIEFRVTKGEMKTFLEAGRDFDMEMLRGKGAAFGEAFLSAARLRKVGAEGIAVNEAAGSMRLLPTDSEPTEGEVTGSEKLTSDLLGAFDELASVGAEYGYRAAAEIRRFFYYYTLLDPNSARYPDALDAQVMQKLLPKLHGSIRKLDRVLQSLLRICGDLELSMSIEKIERMRRNLKNNGFTSFAEA